MRKQNKQSSELADHVTESEGLKSLSDAELEVKFSVLAAEKNRRLEEKKIKALKEHDRYAQALEKNLTTDLIDVVVSDHIKDRDKCIADKYKHDAWDWSEDKIPACLRCCLLALLNGDIKLPFGQKLKVSIGKDYDDV